MSIILCVVLIKSYITIPKNLGTIDKKVKFSEVFSKNKNINLLSLSRVFLFGARDVWFVVGLPLFFNQLYLMVQWIVIKKLFLLSDHF